MNDNTSDTKIRLIDTNVWLYAFIEEQDKRKSAAAKELIKHGAAIISTQIINEICVNLIKKAHFSEQQIRQLIVAFYRRYPVVVMSEDVQLTASELRGEYALSFWDSLILSSALHGDATAVYSEDMQDGLVIRRQLRIINPFAPGDDAAA